MAPSLWNDKKKLILFLEPMLLFHPAKYACNSSLATNTPTSILQQGQWLGGGSGFNICGDLRTLCMHGRLKEALVVLHFMDNRDVLQDDSAYASLLQGCGKLNALLEGKLVHAHIIQTGFSPNTSLGNKLLSMYAKCGSLVDARQAFEEMPQRNVVSWTAMIATYARHGRAQEALTLFYEMQRAGIQPDEFAFASVLPACANMAALEQGKEVHDFLIKSGFQSNVFVGSALIDMYAKCGSIKIARKLFDSMPERDVVSWSAMIAGYSQSGHTTEALTLFHQMQLADMTPSFSIMVIMLPACADLAFLQLGKCIHGCIIRNGYESDITVESALIDMYAKCGNIDIARQLFNKMSKRNVVSWTAMIAGYGMYGHGEDALSLFSQMQKTEVKPNEVTFISVLSACSHAGLVDEGRYYFDCMIQYVRND